MAYTDIDKPSDYFNTKLYTGNGSTQSITGINFQSDMVWTKARSGTYGTQDHAIIDVVRGVTKTIRPNKTTAEGTETNTITSFDTDGYTIGGDNGKFNQSSTEYVSWNWLADNTSGSSNTDGSITSTVSANTTSGFSIVSYTGTGSAGTLGHGLGSTPKMIIVKCRSDADTWAVYHENVGATKYMELDTTAAEQVSTQPWNDTAPASSVFTVGNWSATNGSSRTYIAYCFAEKKGFSKIGSYTGNGSTEGTFVYTGFKPAFVIYKKSSASGSDWIMVDNKRNTFNVLNKELYSNVSTAEGTVDLLDFTSNGFKCRRSHTSQNESGQTYIYMAFAENPLVGTNDIPATAR